MKTHRVQLNEDSDLTLALPTTWAAQQHETFAGLFTTPAPEGQFQPNITVTIHAIEEGQEVTPEALKERILLDYQKLLGYKVLGSQKITFLNSPGTRIEALLIADNGLRIVQAARVGTIQHEGVTYLVQVSGVCTKGLSPELLPEIREALKTVTLASHIPTGLSMFVG